MRIKKIGEAKIDLEEEVWYVEGQRARFVNDRRLIDHRSDLKSLRSTFAKVIRMDTPSRRKPVKREAYFEAREEYRHELREALRQAYRDILEESFGNPILLQKVKDYDHPREWRHALYQGIIFEMDRHGASRESIRETVDAWLAREAPAS